MKVIFWTLLVYNIGLLLGALYGFYGWFPG